MKKPIQRLKFLLLLSLLFGAGMNYSQCTASFTYAVGANGMITFSNTSAPTTTTSSYYWNFGDNTGTIAADTVSHVYTVNSSYVVTLSYIAGTCSNVATQTITVTNVTAPVCNLTASINASVYTGGQVYFGNGSGGMAISTTYTVDFGDGSPLSYPAFPASHTYTANGSYTLTLTADNNFTPACTSTYSTVVVATPSCNITPDFTYSVGANGVVDFYSTSTNTTSGMGFIWLFGYGGIVSDTSLVSTSETYTSNGVFPVTLILYSQACGSVQVTHTVSVTNAISPPCSVNAYFNTYQINAGHVIFSNGSSSNYPSTYIWNFGDGDTSAVQWPTHNYTANGSYTVTLTVYSNTCTATYTDVVNITAFCGISADYSYTVNSNGNVSFASTSVGTNSTTTYQWDFGDGNTASGASTSHTYGYGYQSFTVTLVVINSVPSCTDVAIKTIIDIPTSTCIANSGFAMVPSGTPHAYYAVPSNTSNISSARWSWGDGSSSNTLFASHTFSAAGIYNICLTVVLNCGDSTTTCLYDTLSRVAGNTSIISVQVATAQQIATGIKNISNEQLNYTVAPNPGNGNFNVSMNGLTATRASITVYNLVGAVIYTTEADVINGALTKDIQLNDVSGGVYFIKAGDEHNASTKKLIISK